MARTATDSLSPVFLLLLLVTACLRLAGAIQCYCDESWGLPSPECFNNRYTCNSTRGCYLRRWYSHSVIKRSWDCIKDKHGVHTQINSTVAYCGAFNTPDNVYKCCNSSDMCNQDLSIVLEMEVQMTPSLPVVTPSSSVLDTTGGGSGSLVAVFVVSLSLFLLLVALLLLVSLLLVLWRRRLLARQDSAPAKTHNNNLTTQTLEMVAFLGESTSSSSLPYQVLADIEDIVKLNYQIEIGRFGVFYHGYHEGKEVALKKFGDESRSGWFRESFMYTSVLQPHENVLSFFTSAMVPGATDCSPELWLVTKYHEFGSLQDYLRQHALPGRLILQMAASVSSGLAHLHSESSGNQANVPVAHCNLTSRNILVKENLSCCIGDFRLAVFKHKNETCRSEEGRVGTVRYMAPEVLSQPLGTLSFETFKQADVYSLGLVLWEVCQRASYSGVSAEAYQVPFQGLVPPEPSLEDMQRLVVTEKTQPTISNKWNHSKLLREMTKVMRECWYYTSTARPTAVYLKKKLLKMSQEFENTDFDSAAQVEGAAAPGKKGCGDGYCGKVYVSTL